MVSSPAASSRCEKAAKLNSEAVLNACPASRTRPARVSITRPWCPGVWPGVGMIRTPGTISSSPRMTSSATSGKSKVYSG